ncbi:MAG TPA: glycosyltransferase family 39 protein [Candidatus Dormibacteraeota bacterium]|nr:glycosyltransferase family 39 protein [Candidatus Dormibacteraeota bacterium]
MLSALAALLADPELLLPTPFGAAALAVFAIGLGLWGVTSTGDRSTQPGSPRRADALRVWWRAPAWPRAPGLAGWELALLAVILLLFGLIVGRLIAVGSTLGWDESVYALRARSWVEGTPSTGWAIYRSPGMAVLGMGSVIAGGSETSFRVFGLLAGFGVLLGAWWLCRSIAGPAAGLLVALVLAGFPELQFQSSLYLTDVPATAVLLWLAAVVWRRCESGAVTWRLAAIAGSAAAAAFYLRYGSALPLILVPIPALLVWWRTLIGNRAVVLGTAGLVLLLLVPHFMESIVKTGTPWGVLMRAFEVSVPPHLGQPEGSASIFGIASQLMSRFTSWPAVALAIAGVGAGFAMTVLGPRSDRLWRGYAFLLLPAIGQVLVGGSTFHAEMRYYLFPIALLLAAGSVSAVAAWRAEATRWQGPVAVLTIIGALLVVMRAGVANVQTQTAAAPGGRVVVLAAEAIRDDAGGDCSVLTDLVPQVTWYSGCAAYPFGNPPRGGLGATLPGGDRYLLIFAGNTVDQPSGSTLADYLQAVEPTPVATIRGQGGEPIATIHRFP